MALDYTTDVLPHLVEGNLAATRTAINADMRHLRAADITGLRKLIVGSGMLHALGFGGISGILGVAYPTLDADSKMLADSFLLDIITTAPYPSDTHDGGRIVLGIMFLANAYAASLRNGYTSQRFNDEMHALTGGRRYGSVTNQQILDAIAAHEAQLAAEQLVQDYEGALGQHVDIHTMTRTQVVAGMRAAADQLEGA
jgi:hypothetical protein